MSHNLADESSSARLGSSEFRALTPLPPPVPGKVPREAVSSQKPRPVDNLPLVDTGVHTRPDGLQPPLANSFRTIENRDPSEKKPLPPPPPPPRSTLPPVRSPKARAEGASVGPTEPAPRSGIGTANTRWRGDLPQVVAATDPNSPRSDQTDLAPASDSDHELADEVTRSAPSWLLSLVIHLIVLLILALLTSPMPEGFQNLVVEFGIAERSDDDASELDLSSPIMNETIEATEDALTETMVEADVVELFEDVETFEQADIQPEQLGPGSVSITKPMFGGRTGAMRNALMAMYGATPETQEAVKLGLAWLKRQQTSRGHWQLDGPYDNGANTDNSCAATAMALLAFAGDGNTHLEGPYREEVHRGVKALIQMQDRTGFMATKTRGNDRAYAQAQATIALCELYGMTKDSWLRGYAQLAIDYAFTAQGPGGGWRYRPREPGDMSVTGWYVMAVQSAMAAGLEVKDSQVREISNFLDSVSVYNGAAYSYQPGQGVAKTALTAEGCYAANTSVGIEDTHQ